MINAIKNSHLILVEGKKRSGKFTFTLFLINEYLKEKTLVFSAYDKKIFSKRVEIIKKLYENLNLDNFIFLNIKENFFELKKEFGFEFFLEDIKKAYKDHLPKVIIFQRFDLLFQIQDFDNVEIFIKNLINFCEENSVKVFFISELEKNSAYFIDFLENYIDIHFITQKEKNYIKIKIESSIFPVEVETFKFIKSDKLELIPEVVNINYYKNKKNKSILLISQDEYITSLNKYILNDFELNIATSTSQALKFITQNPALIIYNPISDEDNIKDICHLNKNNISVLYISNKEFLRNADKMEIIKEGCFEAFSKYFNFEEYMIELQRGLGNFFYKEKIKHLKDFSINHLDDFINTIKYYLENRIFFSFVKTNRQDFSLRKGDLILKKDNYSYLVLINVSKYETKKLLNKMNIKYEFIISANEINNIEDLF